MLEKYEEFLTHANDLTVLGRVDKATCQCDDFFSTQYESHKTSRICEMCIQLHSDDRSFMLLLNA